MQTDAWSPYGPWEEVGAGSASGGGVSNSSDDSTGSAMAVAPDGTPYVAWTESHYSGSWQRTINVRRWTGSNWENVGSLPTYSQIESLSLAIAPDGTPYVVWNAHISTPPPLGSFPILARRWNGSIWENVGSGGVVDSWGGSPSLAIAPDGTPYVAWDDSSWSHGYNIEVYVRRFNGSCWEEVATGSAGGGNKCEKSLGNMNRCLSSTVVLSHTPFGASAYRSSPFLTSSVLTLLNTTLYLSLKV